MCNLFKKIKGRTWRNRKKETLARHERILYEYCDKNKLNIEHIYKEIVSGESIENRPEMKN